MECSQKSLLDISCHLFAYQCLKGLTYFLAIFLKGIICHEKAFIMSEN